MSIYLREHAETSRSKAWIAHMAGPVLEWWSGKTLAEIHKLNCRDYTKWRTAQPIKQQRKGTKPKAIRRVSEGTARHELSVLSAAIHHYHEDPRYGPLDAMPVIELPPKPTQRENYFLTRQQIAERVRAARRGHVARMLLIGFYTGTRPGTILRLGWLRGSWPWAASCWFPRPGRLRCRMPASKSKCPPTGDGARLRLLLRYWKKADLAKGIVYVIHYQGKPIATKLRRSWDTVRRAAGHEAKDGAHILRHSCATDLMRRGVPIFEAAGYLGMSAATLESVYGHHSPSFQAGAADVGDIHVTSMKRANRTGTR